MKHKVAYTCIKSVQICGIGLSFGWVQDVGAVVRTSVNLPNFAFGLRKSRHVEQPAAVWCTALDSMKCSSCVIRMFMFVLVDDAGDALTPNMSSTVPAKRNPTIQRNLLPLIWHLAHIYIHINIKRASCGDPTDLIRLTVSIQRSTSLWCLVLNMFITL